MGGGVDGWSYQCHGHWQSVVRTLVTPDVYGCHCFSTRSSGITCVTNYSKLSYMGRDTYISNPFSLVKWMYYIIIKNIDQSPHQQSSNSLAIYILPQLMSNLICCPWDWVKCPSNVQVHISQLVYEFSPHRAAWKKDKFAAYTGNSSYLAVMLLPVF